MPAAYFAYLAANDETSLILDYLRECHVDSQESPSIAPLTLAADWLVF